MKTLYEDMIIDFLESNNCEDITFGMETEEGTAISYVITGAFPWNGEFEHCEIMIKGLTELPIELRRIANNFDINKKVCDKVIAAEGKGVNVAALIELNKELHQQMDELAMSSEEFICEFFERDIEENEEIIVHIYEETRELDEDDDEMVWTESANTERTFNAKYIQGFIDWLSNYQNYNEIYYHINNHKTENTLDNLIEKLSNNEMDLTELNEQGIQCLRRYNGQWNEQIMECTFEVKVK